MASIESSRIHYVDPEWLSKTLPEPGRFSLLMIAIVENTALRVADLVSTILAM